MTTLLAAMVSVYLGFHAAKMDPRPEDRKDAEIADGAGELGFFPPYSWWPLWCGLALAVIVVAVALSAWWLVRHRLRPRLPRPHRPGLRVLPRGPRALALPARLPLSPLRGGLCVSRGSGCLRGPRRCAVRRAPVTKAPARKPPSSLVPHEEGARPIHSARGPWWSGTRLRATPRTNAGGRLTGPRVVGHAPGAGARRPPAASRQPPTHVSPDPAWCAAPPPADPRGRPPALVLAAARSRVPATKAPARCGWAWPPFVRDERRGGLRAGAFVGRSPAHSAGRGPHRPADPTGNAKPPAQRDPHRSPEGDQRSADPFA